MPAMRSNTCVAPAHKHKVPHSAVEISTFPNKKFATVTVKQKHSMQHPSITSKWSKYEHSIKKRLRSIQKFKKNQDRPRPQAEQVQSKRSRTLNSRKKQSKTKAAIIIHVQNTLNNTIITITDLLGNTKAWCSSGSIGFKTFRRSSNFAAENVAETAAQKCKQLGIRHVIIKIKGIGYGKRAILRKFKSMGIRFSKIIEATPVVHNGCRPPKKRRV
uniref:Ribosomal protein S11 n=1 Tax=Entransia fimbriata TaxID=130991 RepID=U5YE84_9VIRI|nr:ribosomal protein S11 [Entransia fimbriata]AGZ90303.1 ribosomal protein S11 [Entransia fimbriata]